MRSKIFIDNKEILIEKPKSILSIALEEGFYIPHLCFHPQMDSRSELRSLEEVFQGGSAHKGEAGKPFEGCHLCFVEIEGRDGLFQSCKTLAEDGMRVISDSPQLQQERRTNLAAILERHPHACLLCAQAEGCDRKICSVHIPEDERCCLKFGNCELQKVVEFIGIEEGLPPYVPFNLAVQNDESVIKRDYNLCVGCLRCVKICQEVKGAEALGFTFDSGQVFVGSKRPALRESGCQFCGFCIEVCPTGALTDKDIGAGEREKYLVPCRNTCPAEVDVPRYIRLVKEGKFDEALGVIFERIPLPGVVGRVCFHPCEAKCRRGSLDQPVAICALKRAAWDYGRQIRYPGREKTGKKVAVIGSGPAGLTAAYYLNRLGHSVTLFEALPVKGGMLHVGIPPFRLPREVLDQEIKYIEDSGVTIKTNHRIDFVEDLFSKGFEAIFVATGAHKGRRLQIPGDETEGVIDGVTFLRDVGLSKEVKIGERVAVIGGGNVATDSARNAIRQGAREVSLFYRRTRSEMPAYAEEVDAMVEEGVKIEFQVAPQRIEKLDGDLEVEFIMMDMGELDHSKRRRPIPRKGSEFKLRFDTVIFAIGQESELPKGMRIVFDESGKKVNSSKGVFWGGDLLTGSKSVIEAIASGRQGAILIDKILGGKGEIGQFLTNTENLQLWSGTEGVRISQGRVQIPTLLPQERAHNFTEVNLGLDVQTAIAEGKRCLNCDLRFHVKPAILPPKRWFVLAEENILGVPEEEGVYALFDEGKETYQIAGTENLKKSLLEGLESMRDIFYFSYEANKMFTARERQLLQQHLKKFGQLPPGNDVDNDLF